MKRTCALLLAMLLLTGCGAQKEPPETTETMPDPLANFSYSIIPHQRQASGFFLREKVLPEIIEYEICYRNPNGEEVLVVSQGSNNSRFEIVNDRIYYVDGGLHSVDFMGENRRDFLSDYEILRLLGQKDGMLVCQGLKLVENVDDPAAADGTHWANVQLLISPDYKQVTENNME